jgi:hypothetical protein
MIEHGRRVVSKGAGDAALHLFACACRHFLGFMASCFKTSHITPFSQQLVGNRPIISRNFRLPSRPPHANVRA